MFKRKHLNGSEVRVGGEEPDHRRVHADEALADERAHLGRDQPERDDHGVRDHLARQFSNIF